MEQHKHKGCRSNASEKPAQIGNGAAGAAAPGFTQSDICGNAGRHCHGDEDNTRRDGEKHGHDTHSTIACDTFAHISAAGNIAKATNVAAKYSRYAGCRSTHSYFGGRKAFDVCRGKSVV
jgi:hypothetical protein